MKRIILFITILIFSGSAFAQTAYFKVKNAGRLEKIISVSTGGFLSAGTDSNGFYEITRWDNNYNPTWVVKITNSSLLPSYRFLEETSDGNFYATSSSNHNTGSFYVIRISSTGSVLWQNNYSSNSNNTFFGALSFSKAAGTDNGFLFGVGNCSASNMIVKCDDAGTIVWKKKFLHSQANGIISCFSIIPDGNFYVATSSFNSKNLMIYKLDLTGNLIDEKVYDYTGSTSIKPGKMVKTSTGYAQIVTNNNTNNGTMAVAFYNTNLSIQSFNELTVSFPFFTLFDIVAVPGTQDVVVCGTVKNTWDNLFTLKLSSSGTIGFDQIAEAQASYPVKNVIMSGIAMASSNEILQVGYEQYGGAIMSKMDLQGNGLCNGQNGGTVRTSNSLNVISQPIINSTGLLSSSPATYTTTKISDFEQVVHCGNVPTVIENQYKQNTQIDIYPNPASGQLFISGDDNMAEYEVSITTLDGKIVLKTKSMHQQINIQSLETGIYFAEIQSAEKVVSYKKLIVE